MIPRWGWGVILVLSGTALGFRAVEAQSGVPASSSVGAASQSPPSTEELAQWMEEEGGAERVRGAILAHVAAVPGREGTLWVQLLSILERVDASAAPAAIRGVGLGAQSEGLSGSEVVMSGLSGVSVDDRAPLLALAAHLAGSEDPERAAEIRSRLIDQHPDAPETTEVRLLQAVWLLEGEGTREEGMGLLEDLIVSSPQHALAPEARRLYEANGGRGRAR